MSCISTVLLSTERWLTFPNSAEKTSLVTCLSHCFKSDVVEWHCFSIVLSICQKWVMPVFTPYMNVGDFISMPLLTYVERLYKDINEFPVATLVVEQSTDLQ